MADVTAHGHLHWTPLLHDGTRSRAAALSAWLDAARPDLLVVDVSVEVLLLARLHGVPAVGVVLPGRRDDRAHLLGFGVAEALVGFWPRTAGDMTPGLPDPVLPRRSMINALGAPQSLLLLGGTSDIALAIARRYAARAGLRVVLAARPSERRAGRPRVRPLCGSEHAKCHGLY